MLYNTDWVRFRHGDTTQECARARENNIAWLASHADALGRTWANELKRHFR